MSSAMKVSLLALVSAAAAVPHYGSHSRFHRPSGGWGSHHNGTGGPYPTGTGVYPAGEKTTTILETQYSTETVVSTIYATRPGGEAPNSVGAADVSTGAAACGPETVYVTATNKVTVTVPAGGAAPSSTEDVYSMLPVGSGAPIKSAPASSAAVSSAPGYEAPVPSSAGEEKVTYSFPHKPLAETSAAAVPTSAKEVYTAPAVSSVPVETPASSAAPESSAAPKPSGSPSYSGGKRGLAYNDANLCNSFGNSKFSFAYNWGSTENGELPQGVKYVPMLHSLKPELGMTTDKWFGDVKTAVEGGSNAVMGFNEPDHPEQANMSPEAACSAWKEYLNPLASKYPDLTILGPSVTNGPAPMGLDWLSRFQTACSDAVVHATNIHFYDIYDDGTVDRLKAQVEKAAEQTGKKVWLTEFGLNPGSASDEQAAAFLKGAIEYLDGSDKVQGYSYFMVGTGQYQLNSGSGLSATGEVYSS